MRYIKPFRLFESTEMDLTADKLNADYNPKLTEVTLNRLIQIFKPIGIRFHEFYVYNSDENIKKLQKYSFYEDYTLKGRGNNKIKVLKNPPYILEQIGYEGNRHTDRLAAHENEISLIGMDYVLSGGFISFLLSQFDAQSASLTTWGNSDEFLIFPYKIQKNPTNAKRHYVVANSEKDSLNKVLKEVLKIFKEKHGVPLDEILVKKSPTYHHSEQYKIVKYIGIRNFTIQYIQYVIKNLDRFMSENLNNSIIYDGIINALKNANLFDHRMTVLIKKSEPILWDKIKSEFKEDADVSVDMGDMGFSD